MPQQCVSRAARKLFHKTIWGGAPGIRSISPRNIAVSFCWRPRLVHLGWAGCSHRGPFIKICRDFHKSVNGPDVFSFFSPIGVKKNKSKHKYPKQAPSAQIFPGQNIAFSIAKLYFRRKWCPPSTLGGGGPPKPPSILQRADPLLRGRHCGAAKLGRPHTQFARDTLGRRSIKTQQHLLGGGGLYVWIYFF